jgi:hypothetical protein
MFVRLYVADGLLSGDSGAARVWLLISSRRENVVWTFEVWDNGFVGPCPSVPAAVDQPLEQGYGGLRRQLCKTSKSLLHMTTPL